jgi:gamma-glutamylcyclotransferase (GGCT)/AIG2-like uncharacterized protein YtfP
MHFSTLKLRSVFYYDEDEGGGGLMEMHLVFVYGSLRKGHSNAHYLLEAECVEENCSIEGQLFDTGDGYPALFQETGACPVKGELYKVSSEQLKRLDWLEGYKEGADNNLYERVTATISTPNGDKEGFVYVMVQKNEKYKIITCNDWSRYYT